jgi:peroxiredoxin
MLRFRSLLVLSFLLIACNQEKSIPKETIELPKDTIELSEDILHLSDINLMIATNTPIDSVWIADIGQKESFFLPFKDTIKVDLKRNVSDLYTIYVHTGDKRIGTQFWLDGNQPRINMSFDSENLLVDQINTSPLYNASLQYTRAYAALRTSEADSTTIDKFLTSEIRNHIDTPFAHAIVGDFISRNQNHRDKVDNVYRIMRMQTDSLKTHFINNNVQIGQILDREAVKFDQYELGDINDQKTNITLDPSKRYLLDFWFVQCPPCLRDHKRIAKNLGIFEENNIELIGVSRDNKYKAWKRYLDKHDYPWVNVREQKPEKRLTYDLSIWEFPTYTLIDHKGNIQARFSSFAQFEHYINKK